MLNNSDTSLTLNQNMKNLGYSTMQVNQIKFCLGTTSNCMRENKAATSTKSLLNTTSSTKFIRTDFLNFILESRLQIPPS